MSSRAKQLLGPEPLLPLKQRIKNLYSNLRTKLGNGTAHSTSDTAAYRQLALQLARSQPEGGSALLATPVASLAVAKCCAMLVNGLASVLKKPVLVVDLSDEGRCISNLLGLTSEMYCATDERSRYFSVSGRWYISTREGIPIGPYTTIDEAESGLSEFIDAPDWIKNAQAEKMSPQRSILPTPFQNLFFLPSAPARQALVRGSYLGEPEEINAALLRSLHERFSYVFFYGGSVLDNPLMLTIAPHVTIVLHAAVENETKVADLESAQETLQTYRSDQVPFVLVRAAGESDNSELLL